MSDSSRTDRQQASNRRDFLKGSTAAVMAGSLASQLSLAPRVFAAGSDVLKVGLIGCGGRGTGAASQALHADPHVQLTAMGDAFADKLEQSLATLKNSDIGEKVAVASEHKFVGIDAYKEVIDSGVDVVVLATPPHFRPGASAVRRRKAANTRSWKSRWRSMDPGCGRCSRPANWPGRRTWRSCRDSAGAIMPGCGRPLPKSSMDPSAISSPFRPRT